MIIELSIKNFAIIDELSISFEEGMTVLTGETGAGKSIIIDAVQLLTGGRASTQLIKHGKDKAEISGLFSLTKNKEPIKNVCKTYDIDVEEDDLILERTIYKSGKSVCRINHKIVTLSVLKEIGRMLVQIHSQHDTLDLLDKENHLVLVDQYHEAEILPLKTAYLMKYEKWLTLRKKYEKLATDEQEMAQRLDLLQFQLNELEQANLSENEDETLEQERRQLQNFEQIYHAVNEAYVALYGEGKGLELVHVAKQALEKASEHDDFIQKKAALLNDLYYQLEDAAIELNGYKEQLFFDEHRLNEIEARLNELNRLKKKYGRTVQDMIAYREKIKIEIDELKNRDFHIEQLLKQIEKAESDALESAKALSEARKTAAKQLEKDLLDELKDLYLENARFTVQFERTSGDMLTKDGIDQAVFMLSTNAGEPLKELDKVASGGELSRIMLAFKKLFAEHDGIETVIFDEIDTGVSGRVAQAIAEKMYQISTTTQTLCITHLPQVAAMADHHLLVEKVMEDDATKTKITALSDREIVHELGKMMTGTKLTESALEHAEELLELTATFKKLVNGKFSAS